MVEVGSEMRLGGVATVSVDMLQVATDNSFDDCDNSEALGSCDMELEEVE